MKDYANNELIYDGCPGCEFAKGVFKLPCGMAYQDENFTASQDWELPIPGFIVVCPAKKHVETLGDLDSDTISKMYNLVAKVEKILRENHIADKFNIVLEEKSGIHLHIWIMPHHEWMNEFGKSTMGNIKSIFDYAKANLRNEKTFKEIQRITNLLKEKLN